MMCPTWLLCKVIKNIDLEYKIKLKNTKKKISLSLLPGKIMKILKLAYFLKFLDYGHGLF